jgi:hypothetical protein
LSVTLNLSRRLSNSGRHWFELELGKRIGAREKDNEGKRDPVAPDIYKRFGVDEIYVPTLPVTSGTYIPTSRG